MSEPPEAEGIRPHPGIDRLARVTSTLESPVRRLVGSGRLNPLPHAGTISVVLFFIVVITGVYITLFFEFGFEASYRSVEKLTAHPIQLFMRSLHRYSSAALVLTVLVHAWRIFVAARLNGPRRWRWLTGWTALLIVWIAGVSGYWLLWDERAQLINEATAAIVSAFSAGTSLVGAILTSRGSGWQVLLLIWSGHLLATAAIGWFLWRHLRRSRLPWLPPRLWTLLMVGALIVIAVAFPAELLRKADPALVIEQVPIDPFVLFLLPALEAVPGALVMAAFVAVAAFVAGLPWLLSRTQPEVVTIDEEACTGCELCAIDCPYHALEMVDRQGRSVAEVDQAACVACGICIGSCVFDAIELPGATLPGWVDVEGGEVVVICDRHRRLSTTHPGRVIMAVRCAGVLSPTAVTDLLARGAASVQLVGCPPGDCGYGVGNRLAEERLTGQRRPHVTARAGRSTMRDFVAPPALRHALVDPGTHLSADPHTIPRGRWRIALTGVLVLASILLVGVATSVVWSSNRADSGVMVIVHHRPGQVLESTGRASGIAGTPTSLRVTLGDDDPKERQIGGGGLASAVWALPAAVGQTAVEVVLVEGPDRTVLYDGTANLEQGRRLVLQVRDVVETGVAAGEDLFTSSRLGCPVCHSVRPGVELVGPNLAGIGLRAGDRVAAMTAEEYLRQSILDPDAYVVEGFPAGQMLDIYREELTEEELDSLVAYLLSLQES